MILAFHKPYGVLSQFTKEAPDHRTLAEFGFPKNIYPIGRLDWDSEGLLLLSNEKEWNDLLLNPKHDHPRTYHVQVERIMTPEALKKLEAGVQIQDYRTKPCRAVLLDGIDYPERKPPIRSRASIPTSWIELVLTEGKNRQVRKMTAAVGFPTLRLIRAAIGGLKLGDLAQGKWREISKEERLLLK